MKRMHLLSCGSCSRQLDVTALAVGQQVMCVCDALLTVGPPKVLSVGGLACGHCGGVLSEEDTECPFCTAALSPDDRAATTLCPVCAARLRHDSQHCNACGVELRASAIPPLPRDGKCPRCEGPLRVHLLPEAEVIECGSTGGCGGIWTSREAFRRIQQSSHAAAQEGRSTPQAPDQHTFDGPPTKREVGPMYIPCLTCGQHMQRRQFRVGGRPAGVVLDVCKNHGIWFDRDELERCLAMVRSGAGDMSAPGAAGSATDWADSPPSLQAPRRSPSTFPSARPRAGRGSTWGPSNAIIRLLAEIGGGMF